MAQTKDEWRSWARDMIREIDVLLLSALIVDHLIRFLEPNWTVLTYKAMSHEPDLSKLLHPGRILVTRTPDTGPLTIHDASCEYEPHPFGYAQPVAGTPEVDLQSIDAVLVPGLAFTADGARLGHGKGHYDRLLASVRVDCLKIGIVFDELLADWLPAEDHDVSMTHLATEFGVRTV